MKAFNRDFELAAFTEKRMLLTELLAQAHSIADALNMKQKKSLEALTQKVSQDTFKVQVVGTFKNGKSTFINSLLGDEVLPAYAMPCTAVINEVKYGEGKRALLFFKNPLPQSLPQIPDRAKEHIRFYADASQIPPIEIPYAEIEDYAVIPMDKDPKEMLLESPYEKIELYWPLDLLKNSVEIIDSPGLNEHTTRTQVTLGYLEKADAILFVLAADKLCSADEMNFIENQLKKQGYYDNVYFIVNRFDILRTERDISSLKSFARVKLNPYAAGDDNIFFVSGRNALDGKLDSDPELYESSGMPQFEAALADFLVNKRGKAKLSQPAKEMRYILSEDALKQVIPQQRGLLRKGLDELKNQYRQAQPVLEKQEQERDKLRERITGRIDKMHPKFQKYLSEYFANLNANMGVWIQDFVPQTKVAFPPTKSKIEPLIDEVVTFLTEQIENDQQSMQKCFSDFVSDEIQEMAASIEGSLENFFLEMDRIAVDFSEVTPESQEPVPLWQRVVAAGGGFLVSGVAGAVTGGAVGLTAGFAKSIASQFALYMGLSLFGLLNPVTIIAVILISTVKSISTLKSTVEKSVKEKVLQEFRTKISAAAPAAIDKAIEAVKGSLFQFREDIMLAMESEISSIRKQVETIIADLENGTEEVNRRKAQLADCEKQIGTIIASLKSLEI